MTWTNKNHGLIEKNRTAENRQRCTKRLNSTNRRESIERVATSPRRVRVRVVYVAMFRRTDRYVISVGRRKPNGYGEKRVTHCSFRSLFLNIKKKKHFSRLLTATSGRCSKQCFNYYIIFFFMCWKKKKVVEKKKGDFWGVDLIIVVK